MPLTSSASVIALMTDPSLRDRGTPSLARLSPTRFTADAIQLVRRVLTDGTEGTVAIRSISFSALRAACWNEETVGDMKCDDPSLTAGLFLLADRSGSFLLLQSIFMLGTLRVFFGATAINRIRRNTYNEIGNDDCFGSGI